MNRISAILERFKRSFFSLPRIFWLREYGVSMLIFSGFLSMCYAISDFPLNVTFLFLINAILFPFTKYLVQFCLEWFYRLVFRVELNQVYRQIGCLTLVFKGIKNLILFFFSFLLGWIGLIILVLSHSKSEVKS